MHDSKALHWLMQQAVECKMAIDVEEYISSFRPELMEYAADWCLGTRFNEIQQRSDFFEVCQPAHIRLV